MARASVPAWRSGRAVVLLLGLAVAGLLASRTLTGAPPTPTTGNDVQDVTRLINEKLEAGYKANNITPAGRCTDYEFIRRATLDIIGRIATPEEIDHFMKDPAEKRRAMLIDRLLGKGTDAKENSKYTEEYARHWANVWANWLLGRSGIFGRGEYHKQMETWLEDQFAQNRPYSLLVTDLLTAKGKNSDNGAVNFILANVGEAVPPAERAKFGQFEMVPVTSRTTRLFLGIQTQCNQCHDHPFDANLKQHHFWSINAFFRQVEREGTPPMNRRDGVAPLTLKENPNVNIDPVVYYEKRNGVVEEVKGAFFKGDKLEKGTKDRRTLLATQLIDHDNFPKAYVNRMWSVFFGKGFVNPIDDFNEQNQVSNPELLNELAQRFKHYGFDQKKFIRWVCNSNAYSLSCTVNKTNDKAEHDVLFSHMLMKAMSPEQLFESLMVATNASANENKDEKKKSRDDWLNVLINNFGDDEGNEVNFNGTVVQALLMMNGQQINDAIMRKDGKGTVDTVMKRYPTLPAQIDALFLAALNRKTRDAKEMRKIQELLPLLTPRGTSLVPKPDKDPHDRLFDLFWALLNSNEFILNH
jgi:hypothetical protein